MKTDTHKTKQGRYKIVKNFIVTQNRGFNIFLIIKKKWESHFREYILSSVTLQEKLKSNEVNRAME
jgi:hypothetical protein